MIQYMWILESTIWQTYARLWFAHYIKMTQIAERDRWIELERKEISQNCHNKSNIL